jgi:hypothetical protein
MTDSDIARTAAKDARPHRRLSLTRPTLPAPAPVEEAPIAPPDNADSSPNDEAPLGKRDVTENRESNKVLAASSAHADSIAPVVRVMAYLSAPEAALLDDLWMQYRRSPQKPSKSDILRAALTLASTHQDDLTATLSQQQTNTLSRQRISKIKNNVD